MMSKNIIKQYYSERRHEIEVIWWLKSRYLYFKESVKFDPLSLFLCMFIPFFSVYCISLIYPPFIVSWYMYLQDLLPFLSSLCEIHPLCFLFIRSLWYIFILRYLKKNSPPTFPCFRYLNNSPSPWSLFLWEVERLLPCFRVHVYIHDLLPLLSLTFFPPYFPSPKICENFSNVNKSWFTVFQLFSF